MPDRRYRAVVIGCGRIGSGYPADLGIVGPRSHAEAYRCHPRVDLVGVADVSAAAAAAAGARWNVSAFVEPLRMCAELGPDIVSICTPDETHGDLAAALLRSARPRLLFIEKPMATSVRAAEEVAHLADAVGTNIVVNYSRRFSAAFRRVRDELAAGEHGRPLLAVAVYGKGLRHNGTHALDLIRFWFGEPASVDATDAVWGPPGDPTIGARLLFDGGLRARVDVFDERIATVFQLELLTERSLIRFWDGGRSWEFKELVDADAPGYRAYRPTDRATRDPLFLEPMTDCLRNAVDNVVDVIDGRAAPACTALDGVAVLRWAERISDGAARP